VDAEAGEDAAVADADADAGADGDDDVGVAGVALAGREAAEDVTGGDDDAVCAGADGDVAAVDLSPSMFGDAAAAAVVAVGDAAG